MGDGENQHKKGQTYCLLAGLEAGIVAVWVLLGWMALASAWYRRSIWTSANIMATPFYGEAALSRGFTSRTLAGLALYVILYGIVGALFGLAVQSRRPRARILWIGVLTGLGWYYFSYALLWRNLSPLIPLYTHTGPAMLGHLLYGGFLGRYPRYLQRLTAEPAAPPPPAPEAPHEIA